MGWACSSTAWQRSADFGHPAALSPRSSVLEPPHDRLETWKARARGIKRDTCALYLAARDPRTPWPARLLAAVVVAYAFSPIDLIPDPIPILGYLDDLVLIPLGIALTIKLIPPNVPAEARIRAQEITNKPTNWTAAAVILAIWLILALFAVRFLLNTL
jgi:uncharacterized membrane protein YkvA (DUF1232 family)